MTTIAIKRNEDNTLDIGWDSKVTPEGHHPEKVRIINNQFVIGIAGYARYSDILQHTEVPAIHPGDMADPGFDFRGYLITQVLPAWISVLEKSYAQDPDTKDDWMKGSVVIVLGGRVFSIGHDFSVIEHLGHFAIGSGGKYALAALHMGKSMKKAMELAVELDPGTDGPLNIMKGWS